MVEEELEGRPETEASPQGLISVADCSHEVPLKGCLPSLICSHEVPPRVGLVADSLLSDDSKDLFADGATDENAAEGSQQSQ
jgi:hypothetical protein